MEIQPNKFYSVQETAVILGISRPSITRLILEGKLKAIKVGKGTKNNIYRISGNQILEFTK